MGAMKTNSKKIFLAFGLGLLAGAAVMFCAGLLYLRHNLVLREAFSGVTADDLDDALENEFPAGTGWHAVREDVPLPMPRDGRALFHWRLYHRDHARTLMDDPRRDLTLTPFMPANVSVTADPDDGHAVVARLNPAVLGILFGGDAGATLKSEVAEEESALFHAMADAIRSKKATRKEPEP